MKDGTVLRVETRPGRTGPAIPAGSTALKLPAQREAAMLKAAFVGRVVALRVRTIPALAGWRTLASRPSPSPTGPVWRR